MKREKKTIEKKGFHFDDYIESEIIEKKTNFNTIKVSLNRVTFLSFIFLSLILICSIKIIYLSLSKEKNFQVHNIKKDFLKKKTFEMKVIQITQNFLVNKKKMQKQIIMKEKNLILRRVKKDLKIEVDLNHLNLKNIIEVEINYFFSFLFFVFFSLLKTV